eukprot:GHVQ01024380.1.p1 GENE.GHVQ01024380.1~~GHVQ01024380.1.p1  ORF type:complete len:600 (-),score=79.60 GHVQ01024380.1:68-1867(-)
MKLKRFQRHVTSMTFIHTRRSLCILCLCNPDSNPRELAADFFKRYGMEGNKELEDELAKHINDNLQKALNCQTQPLQDNDTEPIPANHTVADGRCNDAVADGRCNDAVADGRCNDAVADGRCNDAVADGRCNDTVTDGGQVVVPSARSCGRTPPRVFASDRLYTLAEARRRRKQMEHSSSSTSLQSCCDNTTTAPRRQQHPRTAHKANGSAKCQPSLHQGLSRRVVQMKRKKKSRFQRLYEWGFVLKESKERQRQEVQRLREQEETECLIFRPQITKLARKLRKSKGNRRTQQRRADAVRHQPIVRQHTGDETLQQSFSQQQLSQCTFTPQLSDKSRTMVETRRHNLNITGPQHTFLYSDAIRRQERNRFYHDCFQEVHVSVARKPRSRKSIAATCFRLCYSKQIADRDNNARLRHCTTPGTRVQTSSEEHSKERQSPTMARPNSASIWEDLYTRSKESQQRQRQDAIQRSCDLRQLSQAAPAMAASSNKAFYERKHRMLRALFSAIDKDRDGRLTFLDEKYIHRRLLDVPDIRPELKVLTHRAVMDDIDKGNVIDYCRFRELIEGSIESGYGLRGGLFVRYKKPTDPNQTDFKPSLLT